MSVQKTPVALIQVLDSEGKVTNFEIEYTSVYVGDDPDIARSFTPGRVREEVTAEVFAAHQADSDGKLTAECQQLALQVQAVRDELAQAKTDAASAAAADAAIAEQLRQDGLALEAALNKLRENVAKAKALLS